METINNVASAAAKAVWGEGDTTKEPVSGAKGDVAKGEPYDAGNLDTPGQEKVEMRLGDSSNAEDSSAAGKGTTASAPPKGDTSTQHTDTRHPDEVPETLDPDSITGPGPKPVDVVAREHGGDAGQAKTLAQGSGDSAGPSDDSKAKEDEKREESNLGTGESYVKTTGFSADGGDFDAKNPGAAKEADRLVHQKESTEGGAPATTAATSEQSPSQANDASEESSQKSKNGKSKASLSERIKAKLHRH